MIRFVVALVLALTIAASMLFSVNRLAFDSYELFTGPWGGVVSLEPTIAAGVLLLALFSSLIVIYLSGTRIASARGTWAALAVAVVSGPLLFAHLHISTAFIAAPLVVLIAYQLSTRRYSLWTILLPIGALTLLGFGYYPIFILLSLLLTSPLRERPDPRLGELLLLTALLLVVSGPGPLVENFSPDRLFRLGLVFTALAAFAVFRIVLSGSERAHPFVATGFASLALFVLGDPLGALALTVSGAVLIAFAFESLFSFIEVSNLKRKQVLSLVVVIGAAVLTLTQSLYIASITVDDRMNPTLASSMQRIDTPVAIAAPMAGALRYYAGGDVIELSPSDVELLTRSQFTIRVLELAEDRFSRYVLITSPPYARDDCFIIQEKGVLKEVEILCSLS